MIRKERVMGMRHDILDRVPNGGFTFESRPEIDMASYVALWSQSIHVKGTACIKTLTWGVPVH